MEWRDLQVVLAVAEHDGLLGGAEALGVHPTTVSRRLQRIEEEQRVQLFAKYRHGVQLTEAGADAVDVARRMRGLTNDLSARLEGRDAEMEGPIRLTSIDTLLKHWMADFAAFQRRHPGITLELSSGLAMTNLTQREADVAVRIASSAPEHLIGAKLCEVGHAIYASEALLDRLGERPLVEYPWVSYDLAVFRGVDSWLGSNLPGARVVMRVPRIDLLASALAGGVGVGLLQCIVGDQNPALRRIGDYAGGGSWLWALTHPQLRGSARISTFMRTLRELVARDRALFEGGPR